MNEDQNSFFLNLAIKRAVPDLFEDMHSFRLLAILKDSEFFDRRHGQDRIQKPCAESSMIPLRYSGASDQSQLPGVRPNYILASPID